MISDLIQKREKEKQIAVSFHRIVAVMQLSFAELFVANLPKYFSFSDAIVVCRVLGNWWVKQTRS